MSGKEFLSLPLEDFGKPKVFDVFRFDQKYANILICLKKNLSSNLSDLMDINTCKMLFLAAPEK